MAISRNIIDEINEKTDIVALVSPYVNLTKRGKNYMGQCPFHDDKSPSFSVSPEKHLAKCMACGEGGTAITFYSKIKHISFEQAAVALAKPLGIKLDIDSEMQTDLLEHACMKEANDFYEYYLHNSKTGKLALEYLFKRGLSLEDIKHFQIGLAPKEKDALYKILKSKGHPDAVMESAGLIKQRDDLSYYDLMTYRITFPIHDPQGRIVGFSGRALEKDAVKYLNTPETTIFKKGETLYHLFSAQKDIRMSKKIVLHEGFFDVIASYKAGIKYGVATMGTALTKQQAALIKQNSNTVIIAYDGDQAGINATLKALPYLEEKGLRIDVVSFKDKLDPDDYLNKYGVESYRKTMAETIDPYQFSYDFYKTGIDLSNANDINTFKRHVFNMLKGKDNALREIYLKKMALDIGVSYDTVKPAIMKLPKREPQVVEKREMPMKYIKAERELLIAMMKDPSMANRIDQALNTEHVADLDILKLRMVLILGYYKAYTEFDKDKFANMLNDEQKLIFEQKVTSKIEWQTKFIYKEEDVSRLLDVMMSITVQKDYQNTLKEIRQEKEAYTQTLMVEKQKKLKNKLTKREVTL